METTILSLATNALSAAYSVSPTFIHKWNHNTAATYTPLPDGAVRFNVRVDNGEPNTIVNVFDSNGTLVYTIERNSERSTQWVVFKALDRSQVATIVIGLRNRYINYLNKPHIRHQRVDGILTQKFHYDSDSYLWTRGTRLLEKVVNPGGGKDELHERVAEVSLLRRFKFDWEVFVKKELDNEVVLCTAFVAMSTIWSRVTDVGSSGAFAA